MKLVPGLYEQLVTQEIGAVLTDELHRVERLGKDAAAEMLARHVRDAAFRALSGIKGDEPLTAQVRLANQVVAMLAGLGDEVLPSDAVDPRVLLSVRDRARLGAGDPVRPGIPLRHSELIVNGPRDLRVGHEIARELPSADRVDLLMSFVKWSGFVEVRSGLAGKPLRVLTTTYLGATEIEALEGLRELGAEIRVSYDARRTRLHAKAWLFHRATGFSTAVIGSSNLSSAALRDGCEWNVRLSQRDNPGLLAKFQTTFDQYWEDPTFEPYDPDRFRESLLRTPDAARDALARLVRIGALPHQAAVLEALETERASGHFRNLVVAATGTGKTVMAALDYARQPGLPTLLFVAHRDRILDQSLAMFRGVLRDGNFGEKLTGTEKPVLGRHVFASIQSLHEDRIRALHPRAYDVVIVDEFHHAAAPTYDALLSHLRPRLLLGLTATPERADGKSILGWFDGRVAAESRLWDALDRNLLTPFQYFVLHDGTDLSRVDFRAGRYDVASLEAPYTADEHRAREVLRKIEEKVRDPQAMRALGFCVGVRHAAYMAAFFEQRGLPSAVITGDTPSGMRDASIARLEKGELCCLFTVDVFNEGVDIPRVDTVLFLRPTESATVFLQQLGRGLRTHEDKAVLTVLDFVGNAHQDFRFDLRFRALLGGGTRNEIVRQIDDGFPRLPSGCSIQLEERAQRVILENLKRTLRSWRMLADDLEDGMTLSEYLRRTSRTLEDIYLERRTFSALRYERGFIDHLPEGPIARALPRILHVDDVERLTAFRRIVEEEPLPVAAEPELSASFASKTSEVLWDPAGDAEETRMRRMLFALLGQDDRVLSEMDTFFRELRAERVLLDEVRELLQVLDDQRRHATIGLEGFPLRVHAHYTRAEVCAALGIVTRTDKLLTIQAGVYEAREQRCDLFFVTLDKDEKDFTPTTLYHDYVISPTRFHWQSQGNTAEDSAAGRRYQRPPEGWRFMLFVRQKKRDDRGVTSPFLFAGPVRYVSHEGERPMSITWQLEHAFPEWWFQRVKIAAG